MTILSASGALIICYPCTDRSIVAICVMSLLMAYLRQMWSESVVGGSQRNRATLPEGNLTSTPFHLSGKSATWKRALSRSSTSNEPKHLGLSPQTRHLFTDPSPSLPYSPCRPFVCCSYFVHSHCLQRSSLLHPPRFAHDSRLDDTS